MRSMSHEDLCLVSAIERHSYEFPWSHGVFRDCLLAGYQCVLSSATVRSSATVFCLLRPARRIF